MELTNEQHKEKMSLMYKAFKFMEARAISLFNGDREEAEAEMEEILTKSKAAQAAKESMKGKENGEYIDLVYTKAPDGKFYLIECK